MWGIGWFVGVRIIPPNRHAHECSREPPWMIYYGIAVCFDRFSYQYLGTTMLALPRRHAGTAAAGPVRPRQMQLSHAIDSPIEFIFNSAPPLTRDEWMQHVQHGIRPTIDYLFEHLDEGGDRHDMVELLRGALVCVPSYAATLTKEQATPLIEKLRKYPILNKDETIQGLLDGWDAYKFYAATATKDAKVLDWHYAHRDGLTRRRVGTPCVYCKADGRCKCAKALGTWWEVVSLLALVQPSSAAAERVFSRLKAFFNRLQDRTLGNIIRVSLFLAMNEREL